MNEKTMKQNRPWLSIIWFGIWGLFQSYAVISVLSGTWTRPEAFPEEAYNSLIFPDMIFIPFYFATSILLFRNNPLGKIFGLVSGGAVVYVMIYLFALSGLKGTENLIFNSLFIIINLFALIQIARLSIVKGEIKTT